MLASICLPENRKSCVGFNSKANFKTSVVIKLKDCWTSLAVTYAKQELISQKCCKIET